MRVARVVAAVSASTSPTRTWSDASVCWRRDAVPTLGDGPICPAPTEGWNGCLRKSVRPCAGADSDCSTVTLATGREPEPTMPCTTAAPTAIASAAGNATSRRRRDGMLRRCGAGSSVSTRSRNLSGACGAWARNSRSTVSSLADIVHPLFQSSQCAAQPGRARGLADPEHACGARAVELQQHAQSYHLALGRRALSQRLFERAGPHDDELLPERHVAHSHPL